LLSEPFAPALSDYLHEALSIGTLVLLAPNVALSCAYAFGRARSVFAIFVVAVATLSYFYFQGHFGAQQALLEGHWTAAALAIGLLPFFVGAPLLAIILPALILAAA
jgi:hypothetical protein